MSEEPMSGAEGLDRVESQSDSRDSNPGEVSDEQHDSVSQHEGDAESDETDAQDDHAAAERKKTGRKHRPGSGLTAGQRLAAAKAAKAAEKAKLRAEAKAAEEANAAAPAAGEPIVDEVAETELAASSWLERNRKAIAIGFSAVLLGGLGYFGLQALRGRSAAEAGAVLWTSTEAVNGRVLGEDETPEEDSVETTFASAEARTEAVSSALGGFFPAHADSDAAPFAHLQSGNLKLQNGEFGEARAEFEKVVTSETPALRIRALEGIGFSYEGEENWDGAKQQFERLRGEGDEAAILADYHLARLLLRAGDEDAAKTKLLAIQEALSEEDAPSMEFVLRAAQIRLGEIDPSLVEEAASPMGGMDPAEMQRLIEQLRQQQGATP